jgi:hypothetical protein
VERAARRTLHGGLGGEAPQYARQAQTRSQAFATVVARAAAATTAVRKPPAGGAKSEARDATKPREARETEGKC